MSDAAPNEDVVATEGDASLFPAETLGDMRQRWSAIQTRFVDEPRQAVEQADELVEELLTKLTQTFADERTGLEDQWSGDGGEVSTEDLRQALQRYRALFGRLLAA